MIVPTFTTPAAAADGTIYVHTQSGRTLDGSGDCTAGPSFLFAVNPDGTERWSFQLNDGAGVLTSNDLSSPAIAADGTIYLTSRDTGLYAIDPDGTERWAVSPEVTSIGSSPAIGADGTIYVNIFHLHAYTPSGAVKWEADTGNAAPNDNSPSVGADGTIYACGLSPDRCHAISPAGQINWSFPLQTATITPALAPDGTIYLTGRDDTAGLYAVNPNGTQRWRTLHDGSFSKVHHSPIVGGDGTLYARDDLEVTAGGFQGTLFALNPDGTQSDEEQIPAVAPPGGYELSPAIGSDGTLYMPEPKGGTGSGYDPNDQYLAAYVADSTAPDTSITRHPRKRTTLRKASFAFKSNEANSTFECKLDRKPFAPCASPKAYRNLKPGKHLFQVKATDPAGNTDPTPARWRWTVKRG